MGTWLGHAAPGSFFICYSLWWLVTSLRSYYSQGRGHVYTNSLARYCCWRKGCRGRLSIDSWPLILMAIVGTAMEIVTSYLATNTMILGNLQHSTMYISFGLFAVVSVLVHHKVKFVPKGSEYLALMIALLVELVLFRFHLHGRDGVDTHLHMLLVYTIVSSLVIVGIEMVNPHSVTVLFARCYATLLQGTWFHQIGISLYSPYKLTEEQIEDHETIMLVTLIFAWHMIGCLIAILILSGLVYCCSPKDYSDSTSKDFTVSYHNDSDDEEGHHQLLSQSGEEHHS